VSAVSTPRHRRLAYIAWILVCLIWGTTYLGIRVSLESMPPALMGGVRWTIAGALLVGYVMARGPRINTNQHGSRLPPRSSWGGISLIGFLLLVLGNGGVVVAEQWISSGLAAVLVGTSPFWMAAIEACFPDGERLRLPTIVGLLLGFSGIVLLVWPDLTFGSGDRRMLWGIVAAQIACVGWSLGSSYSRRHRRDDDVLGTTALQMLFGGLMMVAIGTARGEWAELYFTTRTATALIYLSTIGAVGGYVAYAYALRHLSVSFVSLYAYINPIIAVALGIAVLGERFDSRMAAAAVLVFAGVATVRWRATAPKPAIEPAAPLRVAAGR
jgi:drug/metabolite transporter (DMT)-like permease